MTFEPEVVTELERVLEKLTQIAPEVREVMDRAREEGLNEAEAMPRLMELLAQRPDLVQKITQLAEAEMAAPMPTTGPVSVAGGGPLFDSGVGLPSMNPLYEAGLIARSQFDGDMPELRTGPLALDVKPSLSVETDARSPVAIGRMMENAQGQLGEEIKDKERGRRQAVADASEDQRTALILKGAGGLERLEHDTAVQLRGSAETDHPAYRRGDVPAPIAVSGPSGSALAALSPAERKQAAWRFLSTTQGRRSAVQAIQVTVSEGLRAQGYLVEEREYDPKAKSPREILAHHEWTITLGGPQSTQESMSFLDLAAQAILKNLQRQLGEVTMGRHLVLEVIPSHGSDFRQVGWAGRVVATPLRRIE